MENSWNEIKLKDRDTKRERQTETDRQKKRQRQTDRDRHKDRNRDTEIQRQRDNPRTHSPALAASRVVNTPKIVFFIYFF